MKPLIIRGDRLLFALRLMRLCRDERDDPQYGSPMLSFARVVQVFRDRFGEDATVEGTRFHLANWCGLDRYLTQVLLDSPTLRSVEWNAAALEDVSTYGDGTEPAGIRPILELVASGEFTEMDIREV